MDWTGPVPRSLAALQFVALICGHGCSDTICLRSSDCALGMQCFAGLCEDLTSTGADTLGELTGADAAEGLTAAATASPEAGAELGTSPDDTTELDAGTTDGTTTGQSDGNDSSEDTGSLELEGSLETTKSGTGTSGEDTASTEDGSGDIGDVGGTGSTTSNTGTSDADTRGEVSGSGPPAGHRTLDGAQEPDWTNKCETEIPALESPEATTYTGAL